MAGKPGRSGGPRIGAGRKSKAHLAAVAAGEIKVIKKAPQAYRLQPCFVYIVHEADHPGVCKIGVALNAARRFSHLQVGTWRLLMLAQSFLLSTEEEAHAIERYVHENLKSSHHRGEWFKVAPDIAAEVVRKAAEAHGYALLTPSAKHRSANGEAC